MTKTADFGVGYSKSFGKVKTSIQLLNGEGFKSEDKDGNQSLYLSVLYGESRLDKNDGFNVGLIYSDAETDPIANTSESNFESTECTEEGTSASGNFNDCNNAYDTNTMGLFGGWSSGDLRLGLEYNIYETNITEEATAIYANYDISDDWALFIRHDINDINIDDNLVADDMTIFGSVWNPTKGFYISPNIYMLDDFNIYRLTCMFKY
jgi:hypothetical protein